MKTEECRIIVKQEVSKAFDRFALSVVFGWFLGWFIFWITH